MIRRLTYLKRSLTSSKWAPPGSFTSRNQWFLMQVSSWEFIYLRNHIHVCLMQMGAWGSPGSFFKEYAIYMWVKGGSFTWRNSDLCANEFVHLKKSMICHANGFLEIPRPPFLMKSLISYANWLLGVPRLTYLNKMLSVCCGWGAHLLKESYDFLCKWGPGIPRGSFTSRLVRFFMQMSSWGSPGPLTYIN